MRESANTQKVRMLTRAFFWKKMHYYQFNIGDYIKHTMHLSPIEDITYRRLLDMYYDTEAPIPNNIPLVSRRLRIEAGIVKAILTEFFDETEEGYKNYRADAEIASYHSFLDKQKANGSKGGRPKKTQTKPTANPNLTQNNPKQEPLTTNHKPLKEKELATKVAQAARLSISWELPDEWAEWAKNKRPDLNSYQVAEGFKDYWLSQAGAKGRKADWFATWRNWIRNQKINKQNDEPAWVKQNREWYEEATGKKTEKNILEMEIITPRIEK